MPKTLENPEIPAAFAEIVVSPEYRAAENEAFEQSADYDSFKAEQTVTEELVVTALYNQVTEKERAWELRRQAALTEMDGITLGGFKSYIHGLGGESTPTNATVEDLGAGQAEVVRTNNKVVGISRLSEEPIDFMDDALDLVESRKRESRSNTGPENYATALKLFSDKYLEFPSSHLDPRVIKEMVKRAMDGFVDIAQTDRPNFVEMTNIYFAIRTLPVGTFDMKYTEDIIGHSLEQLPTYNAKTINLMIASMSKLDLSETGESAATLYDLALRKSGGLEKSVNMGQAVRTVANLPKSKASERAFATFLEFRNNLEQPQDLMGLDLINESLVRIVENVIEDTELTGQAKELAQRSAQLAIAIFRRAKHLGDATAAVLSSMEETGRRIVANYNRI